MISRLSKLPAELALLISLFFTALGIDLLAMSDLGISPLLSPAYVLSEITPLSYGFCSTVFQIMLLSSICIVSKKLRLDYAFSFMWGIVFGVFLDFWEFVLPPLPQILAVRLLIWIFGIFILAVFLSVAMATKLPMMPCDSFTRDMSELLGIPFKRFRTGCDLTCVTVAALISFRFGGRLIGLGIGTLFFALSFGSIAAYFKVRAEKHLKFKPLFMPTKN